MSLTCKFGDEEDLEEVPCTYHQETDRILCRPPLRRRGGEGERGHDLPLIGAKMEVTLDDDGRFPPRVVSPWVETVEGIEMKQLPSTAVAGIPEEVSRFVDQSKAKLTNSSSSLLPMFILLLVVVGSLHCNNQMQVMVVGVAVDG